LSTDALVIPIRGSDWDDGGQHLDIHLQTWTPNSAGTNGYTNGVWNSSFSAIAKINLLIDVIYKAGGCTTMTACNDANSVKYLSELRTLRAFYYTILMDAFGGVPLVTTTELKQYARATRPEIYDFVVAELTEAAANLPDAWPANFYGRVTKGAANAILASVYLNAGVFDKDVSTLAGVSALDGSYNSCSATAGACQGAITAADAVINSPQYSLNANWFNNFSQTNSSSPENIFIILHVSDQGLGGNWPMRTLHYNQLSTGWGGPWNGWATTAEAFGQFSATDERIGMWLVGPQRNFQSGKLVTPRGYDPSDTIANPLTFTASIANIRVASEGEGVRFNKFPPIGGGSTGNIQQNAFTIYRLSEMYLIKAEAENELGQTANALVDLAVIHDRHDPSNPVAGMGLATQQSIRDAILRERLLELAEEGKRRTDLVRNGQFTSWDDQIPTGGHRPVARPYIVIFPIPSTQQASNPLLTQNPGY
jgi:starch-binding outer membrane protein, SusD/RagB family